MAGLLDGLVKGLVNLAPQDDPDVKVFNAQSELKEIKEKEEKLFANLGRKVYQDGVKEKYPEIANELEALQIRKNEAEKLVQQVQAEKREKEAMKEQERECPNCGTLNNNNCNFCSGCGSKLPEIQNNSKRFCTSCGAEIAEGMRFCNSCGASQEV